MTGNVFGSVVIVRAAREVTPAPQVPFRVLVGLPERSWFAPGLTRLIFAALLYASPSSLREVLFDIHFFEENVVLRVVTTCFVNFDDYDILYIYKISPSKLSEWLLFIGFLVMCDPKLIFRVYRLIFGEFPNISVLIYDSRWLVIQCICLFQMTWY